MTAASRISILPFPKVVVQILVNVTSIIQLSMMSEQTILPEHGVYHYPLTQKPFGLLHVRPHRYLYGGSINSDGVVDVKRCQQYESLATEGFNQSCSMRETGMATLTKMSMTNVEYESSEGCVLLGEEGGMKEWKIKRLMEPNRKKEKKKKGRMVRDNANEDK